MSNIPLDLSDWNPEDVIRRWREAFVWANGKPAQTMIYERGWFVLVGRGYSQHFRRKQIAEMIWNLESRTPAKKDCLS